MADYGMKVSEPGKDVLTATNDEDFSIKSGITLLKVSESETAASISGDRVINHGLGYTPQFIAFTSDGTNAWFCTGHTTYASARIDSSNLTIKDECDGSGASSTTYYIFYEQA